MVDPRLTDPRLTDREPIGHVPTAPASGEPSTIDVVLSQERLTAGTTRHATSRVRFGKRVVTEERTVTVTVRREEFFLEQADVPDAIPAFPAADAPAPGAEVVVELHEEVVTTVAVPVERVRVRVDAVVHDDVLTAEVGREVVEVDGVDVGGGRAPRRG